MILQVMREVRNFFVVSYESGEFILADGRLSLKREYKVGQYLFLSGSLLVDDVYKITHQEAGSYTLDGAKTDEEWSGAVYGLAIPKDFLALCDEIKAFAEMNKPTAKTSESFGPYSYSRATDANGAAISWQGVFEKRLQPFRRMYAEVDA